MKLQPGQAQPQSWRPNKSGKAEEATKAASRRHERQLGSQEQVQNPALWSINAASSTTEHRYVRVFDYLQGKDGLLRYPATMSMGVNSRQVSLAPFRISECIGYLALGFRRWF
jgi:hypothetical protein